MNKFGFDVFVILNVLSGILCVLGIIYLNPIFWAIYLAVIIVHYYRLTRDSEFKQYIK